MLINSITATAQSKDEYEEHPMVNLYVGPGLGLEYGGIGGKVEYVPVKYLGIFGGAGYNIAGLGWNAGVSYKILPGSKVTPIIDAMYGYNAVIESSSSWNSYKIYYGPSFGGGVDIRMGRRDNKLSAILLYPVRSSKFKNAYDYESQTASYSKVPPVSFSIGFNYSLN